MLTCTEQAVCMHLPRNLAHLAVQCMLATKRTRKRIAAAGEFETIFGDKGEREWCDVLYGACRAGHTLIVLQIVKSGVFHWNGNLFGACRGGNMQILSMILVKGACEWHWHWDGGLLGACRSGHIDIARLMIEKGATNGIDAWFEATRFGHEQLARFLSDHFNF
jgi:hypothetical protein